VVQNVEVILLKGTASVREASSLNALWKVWDSRKAENSHFTSDTFFYLFI
jgi:hypothetical protein